MQIKAAEIPVVGGLAWPERKDEEPLPLGVKRS